LHFGGGIERSESASAVDLDVAIAERVRIGDPRLSVVDALVLDGLHATRHPTRVSVDEAVVMAERIAAKRRVCLFSGRNRILYRIENGHGGMAYSLCVALDALP